jgi:hypothetical protein
MVNFTTPRGSAPLRVGVVLGATVVPSWVAKVLRDLSTSEFARLTTVVLASPPGRPWWQRLRWGNLSAGLLGLYEGIDARLFKTERSALQAVDVGADLHQADIARLDLAHQRRGGPLAMPDVQRIEAADLDVLLDFCPEAGVTLPPGCARYSVWSAHQGDSRGPRTAPALFREVLERDPTSAAEVHVRAGPTGGPHVACRSFARTKFNSLHETRNTV